VPPEYVNCLNVNDEMGVIQNEEMDTEETPDLFGIANMEWEQYIPGVADLPKERAPPEPLVRRIMDLSSWKEEARREIQSMEVDTKKAQSGKKPKTVARQIRGNYRSYTPQQIQALLDLAIFSGLSARKAGILTGIVVRTAQHYVRQYRLKEDPGWLVGMKKNSLRGNNRKLKEEHTAFLMDFFDNNQSAVLWEARDALYVNFLALSIDISSLHRHLVKHCSLTLKRLNKLLAARNAPTTIETRVARINEWMADLEMDYATNCVFVDEAGFNMHLRGNFGQSIKGTTAKQVVPLNRGVLISIIGAICKLGVIDLTLRKPTPVTKKSTKCKKKRKRNDDSAEEAVEAVEKVNRRVGTRAIHFLEFLDGVLTSLDQNGITGR
ncbi:hypothetical protein BDB00DRAFT_738318, partial [Zychaea mexicana]|uniref:uncharacterized protein n=1 Tax=Zychaea mexicana TaxID=64656 RepID=UPI0022FF128C